MNIKRKNICYLLTCGVPGIGKTTFCKSLRNYINNNAYSLKEIKSILISFDDVIDKNLENELINKNESEWKSSRMLMQDLTECLVKFLSEDNTNKINFSKFSNYFMSNFQEEKSTLQRSLMESVLENFVRSIENQFCYFDLLTNSQEPYFVIILDDIFYYESMRYCFFKSAFNHESTSYFSICFKTPDFNFLLNRNENRDVISKLNDSIISNIHEKFEYPNQIDWEKEYCKVKMVNGDIALDRELFESLTQQILENHSKFIENKNKKLFDVKLREDNLNNGHKSCQNLIHQSDIILRKLVKQKISSSDKNNLKTIAETMNKKKAKILEIIKDSKSGIHLKLAATNESSDAENILEKALNDEALLN